MCEQPSIHLMILLGDRVLVLPGPEGYELPQTPVLEQNTSLTFTRWTQQALGLSLTPALSLELSDLHLFSQAFEQGIPAQGLTWVDIHHWDRMSPDTARALAALQHSAAASMIKCRGTLWLLYGAGSGERQRETARWNREQANREQPRSIRFYIFWTALALGILLDLLLFHGSPGLGAPICVLAVLASGAWLHRRDAGMSRPVTWATACLAFLLSLGWVLHNDPVLTGINILLVPILTASALRQMTYTGPLTALRILGFGFEKIFAGSIRGLKGLGPTLGMLHRGPRGIKARTRAVWLGVAVAIPLLVILLVLLAQSDTMFRIALLRAINWFTDIHIGETAWHLVLMLGLALLCFGLLWSGLYDRDRPGRPLQAPPRRWLSPLTAAVVLVPVLIVYGLFVAFQFAYLFKGSGSVAGALTYAEYARRGFFQLTVVAAINMALALVLLRRGLWEAHRGWRSAFRGMMTLLACCTLVILASALFRMFQYIAAYGYTWLRLAASLGMLALAALQCVLLARVFKPRMAVAPLAAVVIAAFYLAANLMGLGALAARENVNRYLAAPSLTHIDLNFIRSECSVDGADQILRLKDAPDEAVRQAVEDYFTQDYMQCVTNANSGLHWNAGRQQYIDAYTLWMQN